MRSKIALGWSLQNFLSEYGSKIGFWTFTFPAAIASRPRDLFSVWNRSLTTLKRRYPTLHMVRVLEPHACGDRYHIHALSSSYLDVNVVREAFTRAGGGILDVERVYDSDSGALCDYLVSYLKKGDRSSGTGLYGCRLWSEIRGPGMVFKPLKGPFVLVPGRTVSNVYRPHSVCHRVRDVHCDSQFSRLFRLLGDLFDVATPELFAAYRRGFDLRLDDLLKRYKKPLSSSDLAWGGSAWYREVCSELRALGVKIRVPLSFSQFRAFLRIQLFSRYYFHLTHHPSASGELFALRVLSSLQFSDDVRLESARFFKLSRLDATDWMRTTTVVYSDSVNRLDFDSFLSDLSIYRFRTA